jgi:hypothetical protein
MLRTDISGVGPDIYLIGSRFEFLASEFGNLICDFDIEAFLGVDSLFISEL